MREKAKNHELEYTEKIQLLETNIKENLSNITQFKSEYEKTYNDLSSVSATKDESVKNFERLNQENNYHKDIIEENKRKIMEI